MHCASQILWPVCLPTTERSVGREKPPQSLQAERAAPQKRVRGDGVVSIAYSCACAPLRLFRAIGVTMMYVANLYSPDCSWRRARATQTQGWSIEIRCHVFIRRCDVMPPSSTTYTSLSHCCPLVDNVLFHHCRCAG